MFELRRAYGVYLWLVGFLLRPLLAVRGGINCWWTIALLKT